MHRRYAVPTDPSVKEKDSDAVLDYAFEWEDWLSASETITSFVVTPSPGITVDSSSNTVDTVTVWLSGGTAGVPYTVACKIVTNQSRTDERTMTIRVTNR
jgi:hypothetical protein